MNICYLTYCLKRMKFHFPDTICRTKNIQIRRIHFFLFPQIKHKNNQVGKAKEINRKYYHVIANKTLVDEDCN